MAARKGWWRAGEWADEWEGRWQNNCNILHFDNNHAVYISNLYNISNNILKYKFINTSQETITIIVYLYGHIIFTALFNQKFNQ